MPIILGAFLVVSVLLGMRILLNSNPKVLLTVFKGLLGAGAIIAIVLLILSGRLMNVVAGLVALIPLLPALKNFIAGNEKISLAAPPPPDFSSMTRDQAQEILGVNEKANQKDIKAAHRRIIQKIHPDQGGSDYLAAQVNRAKDILLKKHDKR